MIRAGKEMFRDGRGKPDKTRKDFQHTEMKCYIELHRIQ